MYIKKYFRKIAVLLLLIFVFSPLSVTLAGQDSFTAKDRELLIRLDERLNQIDKRFEQIDKRFEQIDKRFEQIDKRFEQIDKRFEQVDKRIDELRQDMNKRFEQVDKRIGDLITIMIGIVTAFAAIVAVTIAFALWDRRTMLKPVEMRVDKIEKEIAKGKAEKYTFIEALKEYAKKDQGLKELLRTFSVL